MSVRNVDGPPPAPRAKPRRVAPESAGGRALAPKRPPRRQTFAVITDVHANLPALQAVLEEIDRRSITSIYCCGDLVGYGPWPNETLELLRSRDIPCIQGNVDADALTFGEERKRIKKHRHPDKYRSLQFTAAALTDVSRRFLAALPPTREIEIAARKVLLVHGSPEGQGDSVRPDVTSATLSRWLAETTANVIVCGHTHQPFVRKLPAGGLFVNAGTTGRPSDGDPRVSFAVITVNGRPSAEIVRVPYDVALVVDAVENARLPLSFRAMYRTGRNPWLDPPSDATQAAPPDDDHLRAVLGWQSDLDTALQAALQGDPEGIHDIRVATRRLRAGLALLEERAAMNGARRRIRKARRLCAWLGRALSAPRSHQVHLRILEEWQERARTDGARLFLEGQLVAHRLQLHDALLRAEEGIRDFPAERMRILVHESVQRATAALGPVPHEPASAVMPVVQESAAVALETRSEADLHRLRINLKKLRYRLEASGGAKSALHVCAKKAQDVLGDAHDRDEVLHALATEEGRLKGGGSKLLLRECRRLIRAVRQEREALLAKLDLAEILGAREAVPA